jgi:hypothetical protein
MAPVHAKALLALSTLAVLAAAAPRLCAQGALTVRLHPTGLVRILTGARGETELAALELNAHGPDWKHAPQESATAQVTDLPGETGKQFLGTLPVPNTDGGSIKYVEKVKLTPQGLALEYNLTMAKDMKLNGVQVSILLPVSEYAGKIVEISGPEGDPQIVALPTEQKGDDFVLWSGEGAKVEIAKDSPSAMTIEVRAPTDVVIQDLRRWERPTYEVRFPAILEGEGRPVTAGDRLHLDLFLTLAAPVKLVGP